jgi:hypothetical protein
LSTVPVESGFSAFVGSGATICQRRTTIVFGLTAFRGSRLAILQSPASVQRSFASGLA